MRSIPPGAREGSTAAASAAEDDFPIDDDGGDTEARRQIAEAVDLQDRILVMLGTNGEATPPPHTVLGWLQAGYHPEFDIIETIAHIADREGFDPRGKPMKYYSKAVAEAHERRTAEDYDPGPPPPELDRRPYFANPETARMICQLHDGAAEWDTFTHGPAPGQPGSYVPVEIALEFPGLTAMLGLRQAADPAQPERPNGSAEEPAT